jgi:hypothetical protein
MRIEGGGSVASDEQKWGTVQVMVRGDGSGAWDKHRGERCIG